MLNVTKPAFLAVELCTYQPLCDGEGLAQFIECVVPWALQAQIPLRLWVQESPTIKKRKGKRWSPHVWQQACALLVSGKLTYLTIINDFTPRPGLLPDQLLTFHLQIKFVDSVELLAARIKDVQEANRLRQSHSQKASPHQLSFALNLRDTGIELTESDKHRLLTVAKEAFCRLGGASGYVTAGSWVAGGGQDYEQRRQSELAKQYGQGEIALEQLHQQQEWLLREDNYNRKLRGVFWGNFLSPHHVKMLGGYKRIAKDAPCAVIEPMKVVAPSGKSATGAYLQLTDDMTQTTPAQWSALETYFSPLLQPNPAVPVQRRKRQIRCETDTSAAPPSIRSRTKRTSAPQPPPINDKRYLQVNLCTYQPLAVGSVSIVAFVEEAIIWANRLQIPLHVGTNPLSSQEKGQQWTETLWQKYRDSLITGQISHLRIVNEGASTFWNVYLQPQAPPQFLLGVDFPEHNERREEARQQWSKRNPGVQPKPEIKWVNLSVNLNSLTFAFTHDDLQRLLIVAHTAFRDMRGTCGFIAMERKRHSLLYGLSTEYEMRRSVYWMNHYNEKQMDTFREGTLLLTQEDEEVQIRTAPAWFSEMYDTRLRGAYWGNFLSSNHVQLLGGITRVAKEAPCFLVEPLNMTGVDGTPATGAYLQLTEDLFVISSTQIRALETYLAPILL